MFRCEVIDGAQTLWGVRQVHDTLPWCLPATEPSLVTERHLTIYEAGTYYFNINAVYMQHSSVRLSDNLKRQCERNVNFRVVKNISIILYLLTKIKFWTGVLFFVYATVENRRHDKKETWQTDRQTDRQTGAALWNLPHVLHPTRLVRITLMHITTNISRARCCQIIRVVAVD
jgi:hypothetical protein